MIQKNTPLLVEISKPILLMFVSCLLMVVMKIKQDHYRMIPQNLKESTLKVFNKYWITCKAKPISAKSKSKSDQVVVHYFSILLGLTSYPIPRGASWLMTNTGITNIWVALSENRLPWFLNHFIIIVTLLRHTPCSHTCSELIIELWRWNASYVQKQLSKPVRTREKIAGRRENTIVGKPYRADEINQNTHALIATTRLVILKNRQGGSWVEPLPMSEKLENCR